MISDTEWHFICNRLKDILSDKTYNISYTNTVFSYDIITNKFGEHVNLLQRNNVESIFVSDDNFKIFCKNNIMFTINNTITKGYYIN